jgi:hypothetical protein
MKVPDLYVGKRLFVGVGRPDALGIGPFEIRGSAYFEGPTITGNPSVFPNIWATKMIGPTINGESPPPFIPGGLFICGEFINNSPYSLCVVGDAAILDNLDVNSNINSGNIIKAATLMECQGDVYAFCGVHRLSNKKNFDIPHPSREGWRLRHTCPEGPSNDVYLRGKVKNNNHIELPYYWKDLVDIESITVSLTPIGAHQDVIVKRIDENRIYLQAKGGMPINCHYIIFGERLDGEKLIPEYKGLTPDDYPGDNSEYNINT